MDKLLALAESLLSLLFMSMQVGAIPGIIAYFVERSRLRDGDPRCRTWKPALVGAVLLVIPIVWALFDAEAGFALFLFAFFASSVLFGVAVGIRHAWNVFQGRNPDAAAAR